MHVIMNFINDPATYLLGEAVHLVSILIQYRYATFKLCRECNFYFLSIHLVCSHACNSVLVPFVFVCVSVCKKKL